MMYIHICRNVSGELIVGTFAVAERRKRPVQVQFDRVEKKHPRDASSGAEVDR